MRVSKHFTGACIVAVAALVAACGGSSSGGSSSTGGSNAKPITIGTSLSLSGDFAADGQAFERGDTLWAGDGDAKGGPRGHKVNPQVISASGPRDQVVSNYQKLI